MWKITFKFMDTIHSNLNMDGKLKKLRPLFFQFIIFLIFFFIIELIQPVLYVCSACFLILWFIFFILLLSFFSFVFLCFLFYYRGGEDIDLVTKYLRNDYSIVRPPEFHLVHRYHPTLEWRSKSGEV